MIGELLGDELVPPGQLIVAQTKQDPSTNIRNHFVFWLLMVQQCISLFYHNIKYFKTIDIIQ